MTESRNGPPTPSHSALMRVLPERIRRLPESHPDLAKIVDNIGWLFLDKILRMVVGLLVGVWIARYLGPEQFGQLNYATAFVELFGVIAGLGLGGIVVRDIVKNPDRATETLSAAFTVRILGGLIAIALAIITITWIRPDDKLTRMMVAILSFSLLFQSTDVVKLWFESRVQSHYTVRIESVVVVLSAATKVAMILAELSLLAFIWLSLAEAALIALGLIITYVSKSKPLYFCLPSIARIESLLRNSWPLLLASISIVIYMRIDILMLAEFSGTKEVGIYGAATKLSEAFYFLPMIIVSSVSPSLIRSHSTDNLLFLKRLKRLYFYLAWLAIFICLPLSLFADPIVKLIYGREFAEAAPVLAVHLWAAVAVFLGVASSQYLVINQLQNIAFYRTAIGMACNVFLNLFLIPRMGALGAAIATLVSYYVSVFSLIFFRQTRSHTKHLALALFGRA